MAAMKNIFRFCLAIAFALPCALFARRDEGVLVYMNFDDVRDPLKNVAGTDRGTSVFGTRTKPEVKDGKFVYSAAFKNSNGRSTEPNNYTVSLGELDGYFEDSFSVAFWFKTEKKGAAEAMISGNKDWLKPNSPGWAITMINGKNFSVSVAGKNFEFGFPALTDGSWHHVALVINRRTKTMVCYGDGKKLQTFKDVPAGKIGSDNETLVGGSGNGAFSAPGTNQYSAFVDDYAVWRRPLTEKEVAAMWKEGTGARVPEPSAFPLLFGGLALAAGLALVRRRRSRR